MPDSSNYYLNIPGPGTGYDIVKQNQRVSAAGGSAVWTPAAGKSIRMTDALVASVSANAFHFIGAANALRSGPNFLGANGSFAFSPNTPFPLSANEVLGVSADNANSLGITLIGYEV